MQIGEIYLINFDPSQGAEIQKIRPGVILQSNKIKSNLVTIMPLSSKIEKKEKEDIAINKNQTNRLFVNSMIKVKQISSFDKSRIIHFIGKIDQKTLGKIHLYLKKHFEL